MLKNKTRLVQILLVIAIFSVLAFRSLYWLYIYQPSTIPTTNKKFSNIKLNIVYHPYGSYFLKHYLHYVG